MRRLKALCFVPVALVLLSCAPSLVPVSVPEGIADAKAGSLTLTKEGITISVYADAWRYDPMDVDSTFTPFLIAVTNNTGQDIAIGENSILMYDDNNVQYGVVSAEAVDRATIPTYVYPPMVFWGGGYYDDDHWGNRWGLGWSPSYPYDRYGYGYGSDVVPLAFHFGPITAGARIHGFVYLQRLSSAAGGIKVVITPQTVTGQAIAFTFPFVLER